MFCSRRFGRCESVLLGSGTWVRRLGRPTPRDDPMGQTGQMSVTGGSVFRKRIDRTFWFSGHKTTRGCWGLLFFLNLTQSSSACPLWSALSVCLVGQRLDASLAACWPEAFLGSMRAFKVLFVPPGLFAAEAFCLDKANRQAD